MADFTIKRGDRLPALEMLLTDGYGAPLPIAGATIRTIIRRPDSLTPIVAAVASIVDPATSRVRHDWGATDTANAGVYLLEAEVTYSDGRKLTCPSNGYRTVEILSDLG